MKKGRLQMQSTVTDEVGAINQALAEKVGPQKFRIWFRNSTRMTLSGGYLKIGVPNLFIASWLENHFDRHNWIPRRNSWKRRLTGSATAAPEQDSPAKRD
jgi:chromosomal replication initiation ATPase DnaA